MTGEHLAFVSHLDRYRAGTGFDKLLPHREPPPKMKELTTSTYNNHFETLMSFNLQQDH